MKEMYLKLPIIKSCKIDCNIQQIERNKWLRLHRKLISQENHNQTKKRQEPYYFIDMWDIKLKATNKQTDKQKTKIHKH